MVEGPRGAISDGVAPREAPCEVRDPGEGDGGGGDVGDLHVEEAVKEKAEAAVTVKTRSRRRRRQ